MRQVLKNFALAVFGLLLLVSALVVLWIFAAHHADEITPRGLGPRGNLGQ